MPAARSTGTFIGTSESSLATVGAGATTTGSEVDVLGDNTSVGTVACYALITGTATGTADVRINPRRVTGQAYQQASWPINVSVINGTVRVPLGRYSASRYMTADIRNNNGSASISVYIGYELEKLT
jgi:hypothetical protein